MIRAQAEIGLADPAAVLAGLRAHLVAEGVPLLCDAADRVALEVQGNRLEMRVCGAALAFEIGAASENMLYFLREAVAEHLEEIAPEAAERLNWQGAPASAARPPNFTELRLERRSAPMPGLMRLHFAAEEGLRWLSDGLHVKLMVPAAPGRAPVWPGVAANGRTLWPRGDDRLHVRYFTLSDVTDEGLRVEIDVVHHAGGRISDWAARAAPGARAGIMGPGGGQPPPAGRAVVMVADMTGLPALRRILAGPDAPRRGAILLGLGDATGLDAYLPPHGLTFGHCPPADLPERAAGLLADLPPRTFVWVAAERATAERARTACAGLPEADKEIVTYWKSGRRGDATRHDEG